MSDSHDDSLSRRLSSLESDLGGVSLPGPAAARRRAAQRTRHQVTGGVLAGVAAVALGVFAVSPPGFVASPEPAGPPSDSSTPTTTPSTPSPTPTPTPTTPTTPPDEPTSDPSGGDPSGGGQDGTGSLAVPPGTLIDLEYLIRGRESPSDWVEVPTGESWLPCMPAAGSDAAAIAFQVDDYYRVEHIVEPAGPDAEARLAELRDGITSCADGGDNALLQEWRVTGVGDETYLLAWQGPPRTEDTQTYVEATLTRAGDFVELVIRGGAGQDYNGVPQPDDAVEAITRLCAVVDTECPAKPEREQLYPEPAGELSGWLTAADVAEAGLTALTASGEVADSTELGMTDYNFVGLMRDPFGDGAETLEQRDYYDPEEIGGVQLAQFRSTFPDAAAARAHYDALAAEAEQATQPGDVVENTGTVSGDGYDGTSWQLTNTEFGTSWLYGAAVSGDVVTVVYYGLIGDELTPDQMRQLIDLAAQRIGG